jgi:hypothetical protein
MPLKQKHAFLSFSHQEPDCTLNKMWFLLSEAGDFGKNHLTISPQSGLDKHKKYYYRVSGKH